VAAVSGDPSPVNAATLRHLRAIVDRLQTANTNGTSLSEVVKLAGQVDLEAGVTVDFVATQDLGHPLVLVRVPHAVPPPCDGLPMLTRREHEVAMLIADGLSNKEIARQLKITVGTVKHYVHQILEKTDLRGRVSIATRLKAPGA
jgi:DNA-binding NarL/FixJ family response regulator